MTATLQEMTGGKKFISLIITLVFSFMIIFGWSLFV